MATTARHVVYTSRTFNNDRRSTSSRFPPFLPSTTKIVHPRPIIGHSSAGPRTKKREAKTISLEQHHCYLMVKEKDVLDVSSTDNPHPSTTKGGTAGIVYAPLRQHSNTTASSSISQSQQQQPRKTSSSSSSSSSSPQPENMSKLSEGLKALINAPFARPGYTRPPSSLKQVFTSISRDAASHQVGLPAWLTFSTATAMTMNAPEALTQLWHVAQQGDAGRSPVAIAELQRDVGLKCISFNGIPRAINCLGAFYNSLPSDVRQQLRQRPPAREFASDNIEQRKKDGLGLWDSVYYGFERKLLDKLAESHPDLPVHIINGHYANLLSNPPSMNGELVAADGAHFQPVGRVLTSLVAIACLRAQTGVGPQVVSHVFGLRKAYERGDATAVGEVEVEGGEWLSTEEGNKWLLEKIDEIVRAIGSSEEDGLKGGTSFAPGLKAKL